MLRTCVRRYLYATYLYTPKYGHVPNIDFPCYPLEKEAEATNKLDSGYPAPTHLTTQPKSLAPLPLTPPIHPPSHPPMALSLQGGSQITADQSQSADSKPDRSQIAHDDDDDDDADDGLEAVCC